jgi:hypothetical protein
LNVAETGGFGGNSVANFERFTTLCCGESAAIALWILHSTAFRSE